MQPEQVAALAARFRAVGTAAVFTVLEQMGSPLALLADAIRPLRPEMVIAGPAFTLKGARNSRLHHTPETELERFADYAMFRAMTPGCIVVADPGQRVGVGVWGDLMCAAAQTSGARGLIVDGAARDSRQLVLMKDFSVFARSTSMVSTERRQLWIDFQTPIGLEGALAQQVEVKPGDWVFGDADGVTIIAPEIVEEVLAKAEASEAHETLIRNDFEAGMPVWEVYPKHRRL